MADQGTIRHTPRMLSDPQVPDATALIGPAKDRRLVLYLGAGVSIPPPACGPKGNQVADLLRPTVAEILGVAEVNLPDEGLEALATQVPNSRLTELKERAAEVWGFRDMEPTFGHEVIALLIREGLVRVVSANWDCGVENGGRQIEVTIEGVSQEIDVLGLPPDALPIYKVHGCARRPQTLVLTRAEVDKPRTWARAKVQDALATGTVVFVGLGTVGAYVGESVEELTQIWLQEATTVRVVDPNGMSSSWKKLLGDRADDVELQLGADDFFDALLHAVVSRALADLGVISRKLHGDEQQTWSEQGVAGYERLVAALGEVQADAVLRWWRDGVSTTMNDKPFIFEGGQTALMCVAQLAAADGSEIVASGTDGNLAVRTEQRYFEIACRPTRHWREVERAARARIERRRRGGRYVAGVPVTVAIVGAHGAFPAAEAPSDIAGGTLQAADIAAGGQDLVDIRRAEDALDGSLAA